MRVKFRDAEFPEATTEDEAYAGLERMVAREIPAQVVRNAQDIGYDIWSERARKILSLGDYVVGRAEAVRSNGIGRRYELLDLHTDGFVSSNRSRIHDHETVELADSVSAACLLLRVKRDLPPLPWGATVSRSRWLNYVSLDDRELDPEMFYRDIWQTTLLQGDVVDFYVSGPITMAHLFTMDPPTSDRTISLRFVSQDVSPIAL
jgi:hypothetical protein